MGSAVAPSYTNAFMYRLEVQMFSLDPQVSAQVFYYRRYIDDLLILWQGPRDNLVSLLDNHNKTSHPVQFTYDIHNDVINYLDVTISVGYIQLKQSGSLGYSPATRRTADVTGRRHGKCGWTVRRAAAPRGSLVELTDEILKLLMELVFRLVCKGELSLAHMLRKNILEKVDNKRMQSHCNSAMRPLAARGVAARPGTLHDFHSHEIAEQLTLLDAELFYKIEIPEVLLWAKEQNEEKSPNLTQFTEHFNNMSYWVRSIIMLQEKAQDRERLLLKFIKIMKHLRKLNNFNSYLAILSALDSAPIRRLEWQKQTSVMHTRAC
ncbi:rap guanine nucleotide exchange factor 1-like [Pseudophryne corroboree]|uniref:rap guanine nucleotide exchange factor 1-like n=1 Tax=Pseudophryne corroboree TaxID=495146 RepID=UPI003081A56A